jgi:DNA polymerase-3 subunit gamma/tau
MLDPAQSLLRTQALLERLAQSLSRHLGETVRVEVDLASAAVDSPARAVERAAESTLEQARKSLETDPTVRAFQEKFGATLRSDSVKPNH